MKTFSEDKEKLRRVIGLWGLAAVSLNGIIGAGIFALPAAAAENAGAFSAFMFLICGVLITTVIATFGEISSYFKNTGGPVVYAGTAFGSFVGFQTGWLLYLGRVTAFAANTNALVDYAGVFWGGLSQGVGRFSLILLVCFLLTWVNVIGVKRGVGTTGVLTFLKLFPILLFIGIGMIYFEPDVVLQAELPESGAFASTLLLLVYAYVGFEGTVIPAGEATNPKRDMPRALLLTVVFSGVLYFLIQIVCLSVLPDLAATNTPLADVAAVLMGPVGTVVMTLAAFLSIAGNLSAIMIAAPRMTYALARDRSLPEWFSQVNESYQTPAKSIWFLGILGFVLAISGSFVWLAIMSSLTRLIGYGICIATLPTLRERFKDMEGTFRLPFGYAIPIVGLLLCLCLAAQATTAGTIGFLNPWTMTALFIVVGTILYWLPRRNGLRVKKG